MNLPVLLPSTFRTKRKHEICPRGFLKEIRYDLQFKCDHEIFKQRGKLNHISNKYKEFLRMKHKFSYKLHYIAIDLPVICLSNRNIYIKPSCL